SLCDTNPPGVAETSSLEAVKRRKRTEIVAKISHHDLQTQFAQSLCTFIKGTNQCADVQSKLKQDFRHGATGSSLSASSARDQNWLIRLSCGVVSHGRRSLSIPQAGSN